MSLPDLQPLIEKILWQCLGEEYPDASFFLVASGNLNQGIRLDTPQGIFFLKLNFFQSADIFERESQGLELLRKNSPIQVPQVIGFGKLEDQNFLLMEWVEESIHHGQYWQQLGEGLAQLHAHSQREYGLSYSNYIASLPQINSPFGDWSDFFIQNRLEPLAGRAYYEGLIDLGFYKKFQSMYPLLDDFFPKEKPALLHGDLWSGNILSGHHGKPVLIDPAVYFGHREMDLAFSRLFGGFELEFYLSYEESFPLEPGFSQRLFVYNLYPLLVHLLLFGRSYLPPIQQAVQKLLG